MINIKIFARATNKISEPIKAILTIIQNIIPI